MQAEGETIEMRNRQKGFSLIELLIVVVIILVIAAIAIPSLIRSKMASNEASAAASLQTLSLAFVTYSATYGNALPPDLNSLRTPPVGTPVDCGTNGAGLLDDELAGVSPGGTPTSFTKSGYTFNYVGTNPLPAPPNGVGCAAAGFQNVQIAAVPVNIGSTGQRGFLTDESRIIYYSTDGSVPVPGTSPTL
jgi:type IV pilus assembly protein PilA